MEIVSTLIGLAAFFATFVFVAKWSAKREKEMTELKARVIGQWIAEAIKSAMSDRED